MNGDDLYYDNSKLGVKAPPVRIDSQAKYGALSRGDGGIYMRFPNKGYCEKIWDHVDVCMPVMDGLEATRLIRSFQETGSWDAAVQSGVEPSVLSSNSSRDASQEKVHIPEDKPYIFLRGNGREGLQSYGPKAALTIMPQQLS
ncbi:hypothetical protein ACFE04_020200 [Oxalis oulophora]